MKASKTERIIRRVAGLLAVVMLAVVLFSSFYIAEESGHLCRSHSESEECPVCETLRLCKAALHQIGLGVVMLVSLAIPVLRSVVTKSLRACMLTPESLVSRKVRMND